MSLLGLVCAAVIALSTINVVFACICSDVETISELFARADAVFVGAVETFEVESRENTDTWGGEVGVWVMDVTQVFKGPAETRLTVRSDITSSCSYYFEAYDRYVVFAYYGSDGHLFTGQCSGTVPLRLSPQLLADLPPPILDTTRSGKVIIESPERLLATLDTSTDGRARVGAWAAIEGLNASPERVLAAAERSLEVGGDAEWILAVNALDGLDWSEIAPYRFLGAVFGRAKRITTGEVLDRLGPRFETDPTLVRTLGLAVLARKDSALDDTWLRVARNETEIADTIVSLLRRPNRSGLERGVSAIVDLELSDPRFVPLLTANVDAAAEEELSFVAWALGYQGDSVVGTLIELLAFDSEWARESAAYGLGLIGAEATEAIGPLTAALEDESEDVQFDAALALERIEPGLGWPVYETWLNGNRRDRVRASKFLRSLQTDYAVTEMVRRLSDPDCHPYIVFGLSEGGASAADALPRLREIAAGESRLSREAAEAIRKIETAIEDDERGLTQACPGSP